MKLRLETALVLINLGLGILPSSCSLQESIDQFMEPDLTPPRFLELRPTGGPEVMLVFDETVRPENETITLDSGDRAALEVVEDFSLVLKPLSPLIPGREYRAALTVEDLCGNSCRFVLPVWGWNPDVPGTLINELNPEGSDNNPDCIELYFPEGGNTAGICLYYGTRHYYDFRYILPSLTVGAGDFLIIHCRREYLDNEISETTDKTTSDGKLSSDTAWDIWLPEDQGLSGANGVLTLYDTPGGTLLDGMVYSDREADPEDDYLGWTSRTFDPVGDLYREGGWKFSSEALDPSEAVYSGYTTATRSLCRDSASGDSDTNRDWHTVPTSEKSFGSINTDDVYAP